MSAHPAHHRQSQFRGNGEGDAIFACDFWGVEEEEFVNRSGGKGCAVQRGTGFEEEAEYLAPAKFSENGVNINAATLKLGLDEFDTSARQFFGFCGA